MTSFSYRVSVRNSNSVVYRIKNLVSNERRINLTAQQIGKVSIKVFLVSALAAVFLLPAAWAQVPLDPTTIPHFTDPLLIPPAMPKATAPLLFSGDYYEIAERQKTQQILPAHGFPSTTVWTFGPKASSATSTDFSYPAHPIMATQNRPVRVKWINDLKNANGTFIPHPLPIKQDEHWANPAGLCEGRRMTPPDCAGSPKGQYTGPVPTVVHLHGAHARSESDGIPEAWYLPAPALPGYYSRGSDWSQISGVPNEDGAAVFQYPNDQPPALLFFHDHTLGITAQNVYMGLVGAYILRGNATTDVSTLPSGPYEIPLAIQDKSFYADGSFQFTSEGNTIVVNGKTWPYVNVEARHYRLRIMSGTDERYLLLSFDNGLKLTQIGGDVGFLPHPVTLRELTLTSGERADVIVDFTGLAGHNVVLKTDGVDVMEFKVGPSTGNDNTSVPSNLPYEGPICNPSCGNVTTRKVAAFDHLLGLVNGSGATATGTTMLWDAPSTENPALNSTEEWDIYNFSGDSHPIHLHEVRYEVIDRINIATGVHIPPSPGESGRMDTAISNGHQILRIRAHFDLGGLYAWHCHIIEHEDEQMMRPMCVVDPANPCHTN